MWEYDCFFCSARVKDLPGGASPNHCPECEWSAHVQFGTLDAFPCGDPMRPVVDGEFLINECTGCGFRFWTVRADPDFSKPRGMTGMEYTARQLGITIVHWNLEAIRRRAAVGVQPDGKVVKVVL